MWYNTHMKYHLITYMLFSVVITTIAMASTLESRGITPTLRKLMDAICIVESNCDPTKVGESKEIGWYQILPDFWTDALEHDPSIGGIYKDVARDKAYAEKCILAYWDRYATEKRLGRKVTDEDRARIHNGGPNGFKYTSTKIYWSKVKQQLDG
jgi:hypothetical protein